MRTCLDSLASLIGLFERLVEHPTVLPINAALTCTPPGFILGHLANKVLRKKILAFERIPLQRARVIKLYALSNIYNVSMIVSNLFTMVMFRNYLGIKTLCLPLICQEALWIHQNLEKIKHYKLNHV